MSDKRKHGSCNVGDLPSRVLHPYYGRHVRMDLAMKKIDAWHIERRRQRPVLRLILVQSNARTSRFNQQRHSVACAGAAIVDLEIDALPGVDSSKGRAGPLAFEPVSRLVGKEHGIGRATVSVRCAWRNRRYCQKRKRGYAI